MSPVPHDRPEQLQRITSGLLGAEQVLAVYDCSGVATGFVGLTNKRIILQDHGFGGRKAALTSVPYTQIRAVSLVSARSWSGSFFSSSTVAIDTGSRIHQAEFRGADKAQAVHDQILTQILKL